MIKLLVGKPGEGKTKELIAKANSALSVSKGSIIFIGESDESILELNHEIRYVNISDYPISSSTEFLAFLYGLVSSNYDIEQIYIDGVFNLFIMTPEEICTWVEKAKHITETYDFKVEISISLPTGVPECLEKYII